jgi:hypothetical protein
MLTWKRCRNGHWDKSAINSKVYLTMSAGHRALRVYSRLTSLWKLLTGHCWGDWKMIISWNDSCEIQNVEEAHIACSNTLLFDNLLSVVQLGFLYIIVSLECSVQQLTISSNVLRRHCARYDFKKIIYYVTNKKETMKALFGILCGNVDKNYWPIQFSSSKNRLSSQQSINLEILLQRSCLDR